MGQTSRQGKPQGLSGSVHVPVSSAPAPAGCGTGDDKHRGYDGEGRRGGNAPPASPDQPRGRGGKKRTARTHCLASVIRAYACPSVDPSLRSPLPYLRALRVLRGPVLPRPPIGVYSCGFVDRSPGLSSGSEKLNRDPLPSALSAQMRPPCACTRCFAIARPRPVPPDARARSAL
jgi:hypothetical protein